MKKTVVHFLEKEYNWKKMLEKLPLTQYYTKCMKNNGNPEDAKEWGMEIPVTQHHTHTPQQTNSWQSQDPHLPFHTEHLDPSVCSFHWVLNGCILNPRSPRNVLLGILYCFIRIPKVSFWLNGSPLRVPRLLRQVGTGLDEDQVGVGDGRRKCIWVWNQQEQSHRGSVPPGAPVVGLPAFVESFLCAHAFSVHESSRQLCKHCHFYLAAEETGSEK